MTSGVLWEDPPEHCGLKPLNPTSFSINAVVKHKHHGREPRSRSERQGRALELGWILGRRIRAVAPTSLAEVRGSRVGSFIPRVCCSLCEQKGPKMLLAFLLLGMAWAPELGWKLPCPAGNGSPGASGTLRGRAHQ